MRRIAAGRARVCMAAGVIVCRVSSFIRRPPPLTFRCRRRRSLILPRPPNQQRAEAVPPSGQGGQGGCRQRDRRSRRRRRTRTVPRPPTGPRSSPPLWRATSAPRSKRASSATIHRSRSFAVFAAAPRQGEQHVSQCRRGKRTPGSRDPAHQEPSNARHVSVFVMRRPRGQ